MIKALKVFGTRISIKDAAILYGVSEETFKKIIVKGNYEWCVWIEAKDSRRLFWYIPTIRYFCYLLGSDLRCEERQSEIDWLMDEYYEKKGSRKQL